MLCEEISRESQYIHVKPKFIYPNSTHTHEKEYWAPSISEWAHLVLREAVRSKGQDTNRNDPVLGLPHSTDNLSQSINLRNTASRTSAYPSPLKSIQIPLCDIQMQCLRAVSTESRYLDINQTPYRRVFFAFQLLTIPNHIQQCLTTQVYLDAQSIPQPFHCEPCISHTNNPCPGKLVS